MTDSEKITLVKAMCDETDDTVISAFLTLAGETIYKIVDPYETTTKDDVLERCAGTQIKAAAYYINKRGWDFQTAHNENGVARTFEAGDLPKSILQELTQKAGAVT